MGLSYCPRSRNRTPFEISFTRPQFPQEAVGKTAVFRAEETTGMQPQQPLLEIPVPVSTLLHWNILQTMAAFLSSGNHPIIKVLMVY